VSKGADIKLFAFALAAWMKYISGVDEQGKAIEVSDPLAKIFAAAAAQHASSNADYVNAIYAIEGIFNKSLVQTPNLKELTTQYLSAISSKGTLNALSTLL
jgi:fructuronate reductase